MSANDNAPHELWKQAAAEHPNDEVKRRERYLTLMVEHGHLRIDPPVGGEMTTDPSNANAPWWRRFPPFAFDHDRHICGGGMEVSTTVRVTAFYRSVKVTYVRSNRRRRG